MRRIALAAALAASAVVTSVSADLTESTLREQQPVGTIPLDPPPAPIVVDGVEVLKVQGQVYLIAGGGANVTAQIGDEGVLLADSGGAGQTDKISSSRTAMRSPSATRRSGFTSPRVTRRDPPPWSFPFATAAEPIAR
jgi:hypothetical protein